MPFTKTPIAQTYDTKRINFISNPQQRSWDSDKDFNLKNFMVDIVTSDVGDNKKYYIKTRPGLKEIYPQVGTYDTPAGHYYWRYTQTNSTLIRFVSTTIYGTAGDIDVYSNSTLIGTILQDPYTKATGNFKFTEFLKSTGEAVLIATNGWRAFTITPTATLGNFTLKEIQPFAWSNTAYALDDVVTGSMSPGTAPPSGVAYKCTTAGTTGSVMPIWPTTIGATVTDGTVVWECIASSFPRPHLPSPVFMDGYLFLVRAKADYTASALLPTSYVSTNDIYNSDLDDPTSWQDGDYISAEMYADTLVGLSKNNNFLYGIGTDSIEYFFDGGNATGSPLTRNPSAVQQFGCIEPDTIVQTEDEVIMVGNTHDGSPSVWMINGFKAEQIGTPAVKSKLVASQLSNGQPSGMSGSVVRVSGQKLYVLNIPGLDSVPNSTLVYSFTTKMWSEWKVALNNFGGYWGTDGAQGPIFAFFSATYGGSSTGGLCEMNEAYEDDDVFGPVVAEATTAKLDFDSIKRKFASKLAIIGDFPSPSVIYVDWSDDDYTTWSTARAVTVSNELPAIFQLGSFRRRAFRLATSDKVRIEFMELDINKGIT